MSNKSLAIIGGSQAYTLLNEGLLVGDRIPSVVTPFGKSQPLFQISLRGKRILFMSRHGEKGYEIAAPWVNYRANIWALKELGVSRIVSWSGPGAIDMSLKTGQFAIPDDLMDETKSRASSFFEGTGWGFIRQNPVFCPSLRASIAKVLDGLHLDYRYGGTYVCTEGPRLETPAEIRKFKLTGGDMVGMTIVPEVFLARELEMCYAPLCYITNYAEGLRERKFQPGVLFEGLLDESEKSALDCAVKQFPRIIESLAGYLEQSLSCHCSQSMERYRKHNDISPDWHTWIKQE